MNAAFDARCLLRGTRWASLATQHEGQPFASLVTPAVQGDGTVLLLLSALADHTKHLAAEPRCALMVAGPPENLNPQTAPRLTVTGRAVRESDPAARRFWLARHPYASLYIDFPDFSVWALRPEAALYIAGFGRAARLAAEDLAAPPGIASALSAAEPGIVAHCNAVHGNALTKLAHARGACGRWEMLGVDCDGFDLYQDEAVLRVAFPAPVSDAEGVVAALGALLGAPRH